MASTYSTNLKLQLMATGENTGTWGTVTNTNLGTALEEAIVGSVDVTFSSADVTLSLTNTNSNQTARNMRLVLVGVSGGARQLVVPAIEKIYIVKNELADTCTVKVSGQTGVAVPAGKTMWLCNDGTDVKDVVTHLSSLTLASPLPVGSGGTGATSLNGIAFTGENITNLNASNISSGTLANARTTASSSNGASTIVARGASGEFSAGVITADGSGLTALNASNVSTGTLAVARGGTGAGDAATARANLGAGTVTSVGGTGTVNGISLSGTVTTTGNLTLGGTLSGVSLTSQVTGTLPAGNGGTGLSSVGTANNVLASTGSAWASTALSALPTGVKQIQSTTKTDVFTTNITGSYFDITGLSVSITPSSASSKILVLVSLTAGSNGGNSTARLVRGSTPIAVGDAAGNRTPSSVGDYYDNVAVSRTYSIMYLDSPNTTSSTTYKIQGYQDINTTYNVNASYNDANQTYVFRSVSSITVIEILT